MSFLDNMMLAVVINSTKNVLFLIEYISAQSTSEGLHGISYGIFFSNGCVAGIPICITQFHSVFNVFIPIYQYTNSCPKSFTFFMPIRLLYNCCNVCFCNRKGIILALHCDAINIASLLHIGQYCVMLCSTSSFLCGQPCIIYVFSFCRWVSSLVATCMSFVSVHIGIFTDTFMFTPVISWFLFSVCLF